MSQIADASDHRPVDPEAEFSSPEALLSASHLTETEKAAALERWRFAVERRLESTDEGMPADGQTDKDAELLRLIELALTRLEGDN